MASSYVADTKEQTETKNELIALMWGIMLCHSNESIQQVCEDLSWVQPNTAVISMPSAGQRKAYILQAREKITALGITAGMWDGRSSAGDVGVQSLRDYIHQKENESLAITLRNTAKKLEGAAKGLELTDKYGNTGSPVKRKREEDFSDVEANLEAATKILRGLKKSRLSLNVQAAAEIGLPVIVEDEIPLASNHGAPTRTQPQEITTTDTAPTAEDTADSSRSSLRVLLKVPSSKSRSHFKKGRLETSPTKKYWSADGGRTLFRGNISSFDEVWATRWQDSP